MIRAKFRCLHINAGLNDAVEVHLAPVIPKKGLPNFEENKQFWEYSPSGSCRLDFRGQLPHIVTARAPNGEAAAMRPTFEVGSFYFIDMEKVDVANDAPGVWNLDRREEHLRSSTVVDFRLRWGKESDPAQLRAGFLQIGLSEKATAAREAFGPPSDGWAITFSFAHGPELE